MHKKTTIASVAAALIFGAAMSAAAQTAATPPADQIPNASALRPTDFAKTRGVLAESNLCDWCRTGGITWDYAGQQTLVDWTAASQAVTGELRALNPSLAGDQLARLAEKRITDLCTQPATRAASSI